MRTSLVLLFLLMLAGSCAAGPREFLNAPVSHRFWDRNNKALFSFHAGLEALDFGVTHYNLSRGGRETNPMGKALCESGTPGQLLFFGGRTAGVIGISYFLHRIGRHRLERAFTVIASGDSVSGISYSFEHR